MARVRSHQRRDGTKVRGHERRAAVSGERRSADSATAAAAAAAASPGSTNPKGAVSSNGRGRRGRAPRPGSAKWAEQEVERMSATYRRWIESGRIDDVRRIRDEQESRMGDSDDALRRWTAATDALEAAESR